MALIRTLTMTYIFFSTLLNSFQTCGYGTWLNKYLTVLPRLNITFKKYRQRMFSMNFSSTFPVHIPLHLLFPAHVLPRLRCPTPRGGRIPRVRLRVQAPAGRRQGGQGDVRRPRSTQRGLHGSGRHQISRFVEEVS